jgi:hypothetical protein
MMKELYCDKCKEYTCHKHIRTFKSESIKWFSCVRCNNIKEVKNNDYK